jgi:hypothetical protein
VSKLTEIIDAATTDNVSVPALLRMTKVLAARMETPPLLDWVDSELGGYPARGPLPTYRGPFPAQVLSDWSGPTIVRNAPVAPSSVPSQLRDLAFTIEFREPVSELALTAQIDGVVSYSWPTDMVARINGEMQMGRFAELQQLAPMHGLVAANRLISPARVAGVLDNVRTRVLGLALDLEKVLPEAGELGAISENPSEINYIVTNHIYGEGNAVAIGDNATVSVPKGDLEALLRSAENAGLSQDQVAELRAAIEADRESGDVDEPGSRVRDLLGKLTWGGAKTAGKVGIGAGGGIVTALVRAYYGF